MMLMAKRTPLLMHGDDDVVDVDDDDMKMMKMMKEWGYLTDDDEQPQQHLQVYDGAYVFVHPMISESSFAVVLLLQHHHVLVVDRMRWWWWMAVNRTRKAYDSAMVPHLGPYKSCPRSS